jgi:hypothetical protein
MKFINFTQHNLTEEQIETAKALGATEIINAKDVLPNFAEIANDNGDDSIIYSFYQAGKIAEAIVSLAGNEPAIIHFPISSPRVQAAFWTLLAGMEFFQAKYPHKHENFKVWEKVRKCRFVFSHTARISKDLPQPDGSVKKATVFKFEKFVQ